MKTGRNSLVVLSGVLIALMLVGSVSAADNSYIFGTILDDDTGAPVPDAAVKVTCNANGNEVSTTSSSTDPPGVGHYDVWIECDIGDDVTVDSSKDGKTGTNTGTINPSGLADIGVALVDVPIAVPEQIPEFPTITLPVIAVMGLMFGDVLISSWYYLKH